VGQPASVPKLAMSCPHSMGEPGAAALEEGAALSLAVVAAPEAVGGVGGGGGDPTVFTTEIV